MEHGHPLAKMKQIDIINAIDGLADKECEIFVYTYHNPDTELT